ncbi:hypothetical protein FRB94_009752 [Tulasnella sp. JGI-2019a]|nr:hypothetical protein FRB94_009752 [Tulasnella sp. JGI-2019a]
MRNLSLLSIYGANFQDHTEDGDVLCASAVETDNDTVYAASERLTNDGEALFKAWKVDEKGSPMEILTKWTSPVLSSQRIQTQLVAFDILPESRTICMLSASGDIATAQLDDFGSPPEVVGTIENGIGAARWSPDTDILVIATGDAKLILMSRDFEVITEGLMKRAEFGEDQGVNVGWGSKETQFHGSQGKTAAAASTDQAASAAKGGSSPDDDHRPRISWRGDGAFFVVSSIEEHDIVTTEANPLESYTRFRRVLRVYDRLGALQSTSERTPGLEHAVAWRPSGSLIASSQRFGFPGGGQGIKGRHDIIFYERNGLRHGEYTLREQSQEATAPDAKRRWGYRVREMDWSSDSMILAVWVERDDVDVVQLWTSNNYHWYLKQELSAPPADMDVGSRRLTSMSWHAEDPLRLVMTSQSQIIDLKLVWETCASTVSTPNDYGTVAVVDGSSLLITPFRLQNVPPPMSSYQIQRSSRHLPPPIHVSAAPNADVLVMLYDTAEVELWNLFTKTAISQGKVAEPSKIWQGLIPGGVQARQVIGWVDEKAPEEWFVAVLGLPADGKHDVIVVAAIRNGVITDDYETALPMKGSGRMIYMEGGMLGWQNGDGEILQVDFENEIAVPLATFRAYCPYTQSSSPGDDTHLFVGLSPTGKLFAASSRGSRVLTLSPNCNSFVIGSGFLIYTTAMHYAHFAPLVTLSTLLDSERPDGVAIPKWEERKVERGSRIVTVVPSAMSLVLQMPRGNLETVNPRPLVLEVVKQDLDHGEYRKAFLACRKHRIDLNVIIDHNPERFMTQLSSFTDQVEEVDHINLFLSGVGQSSQPPDKIAGISDAIRGELEKKDSKKYINCILTAHVVKTPPDLEAGLSLLLRLRESDPTLVEEAIKYIIFLVDADKLFDTALGMYDFSLALLVAQHSPTKDPREYLPFLRELRDLGDGKNNGYQKFKIDDHLKRYKKALKGLHDAGESKFDEAVVYVEKHQLYREALQVWSGNAEHTKRLLDVYGDYLFERREFRQSALAFVKAEKPKKAMAAYEKQRAWQELFTLAVREGIVNSDELEAMGRRVGEDLASRKRYFEAGCVLLEYAKDVPEAVAAFVQGNELAEAERVCAQQSRSDLVETLLHPGALELRETIGDEVQEMMDQLTKQMERLRELREKKTLDPDAFFGLDEPQNLQNVDVMTDAASTVGTTFTRYTVAPSTAASKKSKASAKSRQKAARKKGRKGTVEEEAYILESITKMPSRLDEVKGQAGKLLPYLASFTSEHHAEGKALQKQVLDAEGAISRAIQDAWVLEEEVDGHADEDVGADLAKKVPKPSLSSTITMATDWKVLLLEDANV